MVLCAEKGCICRMLTIQVDPARAVGAFSAERHASSVPLDMRNKREQTGILLAYHPKKLRQELD